MKTGAKRRPQSDKARNPIVVLHETQTGIDITAADELAAVDAAYWVTASPVEWNWTTDQQAEMARYVLWAHQRLSAIGQLSSINNKLT